MRTLYEIGEQILEQDNRCTSDPVFQVMSYKHADGGNVVAEVVDVFFTQAGADEYINHNEHNLNKPFVYIASGWKNKEWIAIRNLLMSITEGTLKLSDLQ